MLGTAKYITLRAAHQIMAAAEAEALKNNWNVAIAIVDAGANLLMFHKLDDTQPGGIAVSIAKARTAANFRRSTKALEDALAGGRLGFLAFDDVLPMQGGVPVIAEGKVIGAVGVSGGSSAQDEQIALAGIAALGL